MKYLGPSDVAALLGVSPSRVSKMVVEGKLPEPDAWIAGRFYGWLPATIDQWMKSRNA